MRNCIIFISQFVLKGILFLFKHYEADSDGLVCRLKQPLTKSGNHEVVVDANSFVTSGWQIKLSDIKIVESVGKGESGGLLV